MDNPDLQTAELPTSPECLGEAQNNLESNAENSNLPSQGGSHPAPQPGPARCRLLPAAAPLGSPLGAFLVDFFMDFWCFGGCVSCMPLSAQLLMELSLSALLLPLCFRCSCRQSRQPDRQKSQLGASGRVRLVLAMPPGRAACLRTPLCSVLPAPPPWLVYPAWHS